MKLIVILYVQEKKSILYRNLLYKLGQDFSGIQKIVQICNCNTRYIKKFKKEINY